MPATTRINLTDPERALARRTDDRTAFVGILEFFNGPRGGRYRPLRTAAHATEAGALRELTALRTRRWKQSPRDAKLLLLDQLGNVLAEDAAWDLTTPERP